MAYRIGAKMGGLRFTWPCIAALAMVVFSTPYGHSDERARSPLRIAPGSISNREHVGTRHQDGRVRPRASGAINRSPETPLRRSGGQVQRLRPHDWAQGQWRKEKRGGRFGWWWNVAGFGYFYEVPSQGAPGYVSEIVQPDSEVDAEPNEFVEPATTYTAPVSPAPHLWRAYAYTGGELKGTYAKISECNEALKNEPNGVCIWK